MSVLSDEQLLSKYSAEFDFVYGGSGFEVRAHYAGLRAVADAAIAADRAARAKPAGQLCESVYGRGQVLWFEKPSDGSLLYTAPPAAPVVTTEEGRHCGDPDCVPCRDPAEPAATGEQVGLTDACLVVDDGTGTFWGQGEPEFEKYKNLGGRVFAVVPVEPTQEHAKIFFLAAEQWKHVVFADVWKQLISAHEAKRNGGAA